MNIARTVCNIRHQNVGRSLYRKFRISASNYDSSSATQPQIKEDKFDFEDLKVVERTERRKAQIKPFMKDVFVSVFNRELLAYPEILNKEESENVQRRVDALHSAFSDSTKTKDDRREALKNTNMYSGSVNWTNGGLAMNFTESLRYLDVIASDVELGQQISDHWVGLQVLQKGLTDEQFRQIVDELITGEKTIGLCLKERVAERLTQADFRTTAMLDGQGVWRVSGEKVCCHKNGFYLVLASIEANRLKGFLIHPNVEGIKHDDTFVTFKNTPATPLEEISEQQLSHALGAARLYGSALCRATARRAAHAANEYIRKKIFNGKPLGELPTVRVMIGEIMLDVYASESADYFTAGLLDGYEAPDTELEMAMCRNFIAPKALTAVTSALALSALEDPAASRDLLDDARHLALRGETLHGIYHFIAMNGLHHAGKTMADEIKAIRNPLFHPTFILKKAFANRHQEKDDPKLTLYLAEHLHPTLKPASEQLEYCVLRMRFAVEALMGRHGKEISQAHLELVRLAEAATEILVMSAVLARASRAYCIGLRNAELEMKLAACFVDKTKDKVRKLILDIDNGEFLNLDHFKINFGKRFIEHKDSYVEHPTSRVFW